MQKILMVNEASYRNSGYSRYGRELLKRLYKSGKYKIAELACSHSLSSPDCVREAQKIPWKVYPAVPNINDKNIMNAYNCNHLNKFGKMFFERTCLDFKPNVVFSIRDFWMDSYIDESPFRDYYNFIHLAPVDSEPQNTSWVDMYKNCDVLLTYNNWSKKVLEGYGLKVHAAAPAKAPDSFRPMHKIECKASLGLPVTGKIIGTVMRNQPRKLFDELFTAFRKFLEETDKEVYLYCHTGFPDSWCDIPDLLLRHGITNKVFFTYKCMNPKCKAIDARRYSDIPTQCYKCNNISSKLCNMDNQVSDDELAFVFNCFDIYVQYASMEGLGMPVIEAAACGVVPLAVDYSAMSSVVRDCKGFPIKVASKSIEVESGRYKASPDINHTVELFKMALDNSESFGQASYKACVENFNWDNTAVKWMSAIDHVSPKKSWDSPMSITYIPDFNQHDNLTNRQYVDWLYEKVLCKPYLKNSYMAHKMVSDLCLGQTQAIDGVPNQYIRYDRRMAYNKLANLANEKNLWEQERTNG